MGWIPACAGITLQLYKIYTNGGIMSGSRVNDVIKKERALRKAIRHYNKGEYLEACKYYKIVVKIAAKFVHLQADELQGSIGVLTCLYQLGYIPLRLLESEYQRLHDALQTVKPEAWVPESHDALAAINACLTNPNKRARYAIDSAQLIQEEYKAKRINKFLPFVPINAEPEYVKSKYFQEVLISLEMAVEFYQERQDQATINDILYLMALFYENTADAYSSITEKADLQVRWQHPDYDGYEPFASLNAAMVYYDKAINQLIALGDAPSFDLLFSTLGVSWTASLLLDFAEYRQYFDIEELIVKYRLLDAIGGIEDEIEHAGREHELNTYAPFRLDMQNKKMAPKPQRVEVAPPADDEPLPATVVLMRSLRLSRELSSEPELRRSQKLLEEQIPELGLRRSRGTLPEPKLKRSRGSLPEATEKTKELKRKRLAEEARQLPSTEEGDRKRRRTGLTQQSIFASANFDEVLRRQTQGPQQPRQREEEPEIKDHNRPLIDLTRSG